jgi:hypothetical protein
MGPGVTAQRETAVHKPHAHPGGLGGKKLHIPYRLQVQIISA